jgi:hypothetical protein
MQYREGGSWLRVCLLRQLSGFESRHILKNTKWATYAKEWPAHSSPLKNIQKEKKKYYRKKEYV